MRNSNLHERMVHFLVQGFHWNLVGIQRVMSKKCENINLIADSVIQDGTQSLQYACQLKAKLKPYSPTGGYPNSPYLQHWHKPNTDGLPQSMLYLKMISRDQSRRICAPEYIPISVLGRTTPLSFNREFCSSILT